MRLLAERISILREYGLTEPQGRVYLALLDETCATATSLARAADLARNRLYDVLEELNALGLVDIGIEEPRRYRARSIETFLARFENDLRARMDRHQERRPFLTAAFEASTAARPGDAERGVMQAVLGRRAVADEIDRMISESKQQIVLAGSTDGSLRLAKHLIEANDLSATLAIELYVPAQSASTGGWETFLEAGIADVRWLDVTRATLVVIADEREMLRIHPLPDDEKLHVGRDHALFTDNLSSIHDELLGLRHLPRAALDARSVTRFERVALRPLPPETSLHLTSPKV